MKNKWLLLIIALTIAGIGGNNINLILSKEHITSKPLHTLPDIGKKQQIGYGTYIDWITHYSQPMQTESYCIWEGGQQEQNNPMHQTGPTQTVNNNIWGGGWEWLNNRYDAPRIMKITSLDNPDILLWVVFLPHVWAYGVALDIYYTFSSKEYPPKPNQPCWVFANEDSGAITIICLTLTYESYNLIINQTGPNTSFNYLSFELWSKQGDLFYFFRPTR